MISPQLDWCAADLPRSRRRDPSTSRLAAQRVAKHYTGQKRRVLNVIIQWPMLTACEIAKRLCIFDDEYTGLRYMVSRRTADLARDGAIRRCPPRVCSVSGSEQTTWRAV